MKCEDCGSPADQLQPLQLCNHCWTRRFSMQGLDGKRVHFIDALKIGLDNMNLKREEGETTNQWGKRCKQAIPGGWKMKRVEA